MCVSAADVLLRHRQGLFDINRAIDHTPPLIDRSAELIAEPDDALQSDFLSGFLIIRQSLAQKFAELIEAINFVNDHTPLWPA